VFTCLLIALTGIYEQVMGVKVFEYSVGNNPDWGDRMTGALRNPAAFGTTLGMGILAGFSLLSHTKRKLLKAALVATFLILLYGVFASFTRSVWISVYIVLFAAQFFINGLWRRTLPLFILGLLLIAFIWPNLPNSSPLVQRTMQENTIAARLELIDFGWKLFLERPILGWGSNALNTISIGHGFEASHNIYLTFLVDGGVILFLSFSVFVGYLLNEAIRIFGMLTKGSLERNALITMVGSVLILLLSGLSTELRYFEYTNILFWIFMGVIDYLGTKLTVKSFS
jgi:O-antigen ligase